MLLALLALVAVAPGGGPGRDTPVRLRLSDGGDYSPGDRARVHVKTAKDGYLLVLRMNADGGVRVLYPLEPKDDGGVDGGTDFEVRGRGDREAFAVGGRDGGGVVLAAWSARPFRTDDWVRNGHWDLVGLTDSLAAKDPEASLVALVDKAVDGTYDYDLVPYTVAAERRYARVGWYDPWYGWWGPRYYGPRVRVIYARGGGRRH